MEELCSDLFSAEKRNTPYFLGTVVLTRGPQETFVVVDGQQRLATTTIILAVMRDILDERNEKQLVTAIEGDFLFRIDRSTEATAPKLTLNVRDNEVFRSRILLNPKDPHRNAAKPSSAPSNQKILDAANAVRKFLKSKVDNIPSPKDYLKAWLNLIEFSAMVIVLKLPSDGNAYRMFETLNDRGLKVSQADLVKNYLFGKAEAREPEVIEKWSSMISTLEQIGEQDAAIDYLRFVCSMMYGLTTRSDVFDRVKENITSQQSAIQFAFQIESLAVDYAAILSPDHPKWNDYASSVRRSIKTLAQLEVSQIRHLMLAVSHHFSRSEADKALRMFVNWIVRLFIAGAGKVGRLESNYAALAHAIYERKQPATADTLLAAIKPYLATDEEFRQAFAVARVSQGKLARYYLDSIERHKSNDTEADLVPNEDTNAVNLEHVIPRNFTPEKWPHLDKEQAESLFNRLGNMALLNAKKNAKIGDFGFEEKRTALSESGFSLTKTIADNKKWGLEEVEQRQLALAEIALKTWPLKR